MHAAAALSLAHGLEMVLPLVRNIAMARLMEPREFALALALSTVVAMAELVGDLGLPQYALKHDIGDERARGTLHALAALRSGLFATLTVLLSIPLAQLFGAPEAALAFAIAGGSIALRGFANLGMKQLGRDGRFSAEAATILTSQIVWTAAILIFSFLWADHRAMIVGLVLYAASYVAASHLTSGVQYGMRYDRIVAAEAIRFGAPLMPNGLALAITSMADRLVVGWQRGLDALAIYGPFSTIAMLPRGTALRYVYNLALPRMVMRAERGDSIENELSNWSAVITVMAAAFGLGFMSLAEPMIRLVFGPAYAPAPLLASLMGVLLACRILIAYPVPLAMTRNRTWFVTASSAITAASLLPAATALALTPNVGQQTLNQGLAIFLGTMLVTETIGLAFLVWRTRRDFSETAPLPRAAIAGWGVVAVCCLAVELVGLSAWPHRLAVAAPALAAIATAYRTGLSGFMRRSASP
jgi:PST family polysaccharide transporter